MSDDGLRRAFVEAADSGALGCERSERVWDAAAGRLTPAETRALVDHCGECGPCAESWRLARRFLERPGEARASRRRSTRSRWPWAVAAAAALALVAFTLPTWIDRGDRREPAATFRDREAAPIEALIDEATALPRTDVVLRWSAGPEGTLYDVRVVTERLAVVVEARGLDANEYAVPLDRLADLPAGSKLLWQVTARYPDGNREDSRTFFVPIR